MTGICISFWSAGSGRGEQIVCIRLPATLQNPLTDLFRCSIMRTAIQSAQTEAEPKQVNNRCKRAERYEKERASFLCRFLFVEKCVLWNLGKRAFLINKRVYRRKRVCLMYWLSGQGSQAVSWLMCCHNMSWRNRFWSGRLIWHADRRWRTVPLSMPEMIRRTEP